MRAFGIDRYGSAIGPLEVPDPTMDDGDVLVQVHAAGINQLDAKIGAGDFKAFLPYRTPLALGHDVAGVVEAVGSHVTRFSVGDRVYGRAADLRIGSLAERIAIRERDLAMAPQTVDMVEAAALPLVTLTAWQALVDVASVQPGQRVLIHGGAGGFGSVAVQLAKHLGAHVATTASATNLEWLRQLGADIVIDYRSQDFEALLHEYDLVIDGLGGENLRRSLRVVRTGGRAIGLAGPPDPAFARQMGVNPAVALAMRALSAGVRHQARRADVQYSFLWMHADGDELARIAGLVDHGAVRPVVGRVVPFEATPAAFDALNRGSVRGKIVVSLIG